MRLGLAPAPIRLNTILYIDWRAEPLTSEVEAAA